MSRGLSPRFGVSLVELLVVLAVIGILAALLLPAVQAARETARRAQCSNNLRQIGIALHSYHSTTDSFPPGYAATTKTWYRPNWSWSSFLLPYLEQDPMYGRLGVDSQRFAPESEFAPPTADTQMVLGVFVCPSDVGPRLNHRKGNHAKSNYRSITGSITALTVSYQGLSSLDGMFYLNSRTTVASINDGTSNTLAIGECMLEPKPAGRKAALWAGMRGRLDGVIHISDCMWWVNSEPEFRLDGTASQALSSQHAGGVGLLFADGSVHYLSPTIDGRTLECLAARSDGCAVELP